MSQRLDTVTTSLEWRVLQKGSRLFALLGKATPFGISSFRREDVNRSWAVTAEFGCLRLERLTGEEEVTGLKLMLPTSVSYEYGVTGAGGADELTRVIFGLVPSEMEELVNALRRGTFPMLGYSYTDLRCCISTCVIPGRWPHMVISNSPQYGNVISLEAFVRVLVSSLPKGQSGTRLPGLQKVALEILKLMGSERPGIPYYQELLDTVPAEAVFAK